jgi:integrase
LLLLREPLLRKPFSLRTLEVRGFEPPLKTHIENLSAGREGYLHPKAVVTVTKQKRSGTLSNQFADLLAQAGLRDKTPHRSKGKGRDAKRSSNGLSFHALRHTAVSLLKDAGVPEAVVMELVGHDSEAMSAHYTHVGTEALAKAVAATGFFSGRSM